MTGDSGDDRVVLTLEDCKTLFPRLKELENALLAPERDILLKIERVLYGHLSVRDIENLLRASSPG
jgi:hypothetical protein